MKKFLLHIVPLFLLFSITLNGCQSHNAKENKPIIGKVSKENRDLKEILQSNRLIVLAENSALSYFIYKGQKMGMEYEILNRFAKDIGVKLEIVIIDDLDNIITELNNDVADIIACNYTITKERKNKIDFSIPYQQTPQVLVQRKPENWKELKKDELEKSLIRTPQSLSRKTIHVWQNSSYFSRLLNLQEELGNTIILKPLDSNISPEQAIEMVSKGFIDYTIIEGNVAQLNQKFHPELDMDFQISIPQNISFGVRKNSPLLRKKLDTWLVDFVKTPTFSFIQHKYLKLSQYPIQSKSEFSSISGNRISQYDNIIREIAEKHGWDWRLISALIYQESKFNIDAESFGGAYGLMQFIPEVGAAYNVHPNSSAEVQIEGGIKKLAKDFNTWKSISDSTQRLKFALASYNAGAGHILDAQRLAEKYGKDPLIWDDNVEIYIKELSDSKYYRDPVVRNGYMNGNINYYYVREILARYNEYKTVFN